LSSVVSKKPIGPIFDGEELLGFLSLENVASKLPYGIAILRCIISQEGIDVTKY
jgi:hypothetical protein